MVKTESPTSRGLKISVVTPTLRRPQEVVGLLQNLAAQTLPVFEFILVDGAPEGEEATRAVAEKEFSKTPFTCRYIRHGGGTAIQRNVGIEAANGALIALIDDDIRLESDFFLYVSRVFEGDTHRRVGGVAGYITNQHFTDDEALRWRLYRKLGLLTTFEPGRYDYKTGYPINRYRQPPYAGIREIDSMGSGCAVWRREVFLDGLSFSPFFVGYAVLEDHHFALKARRRWMLLESGDARCIHDHAPSGRASRQRIGVMCVVNYYYVFNDIAGPLTAKQKFRFWVYQVFELVRIASSAVRRSRFGDLQELAGRLQGFWMVARGDVRRSLREHAG
jgi:glycosyltransferase involved in cell wall biosynthesis